MTKPVILTGIRSNEEPTLGNYLGAIEPMVDMQRQYAGEYQINMFVPDLHSFTTPVDYEKLYQNSLNNLKYFVASGLDLDNPDTYIYRQSYISAHSEMTWILDCFTSFGEMSRMTQFKEKSGAQDLKSKNKELRDHVHEMRQKFDAGYTINDMEDSIKLFHKADELAEELDESIEDGGASVGLFNYPVLMAADILLYNAKYIPVGEDQFQHIEITRDIATRFNNKFGDIFTVPEPTKAQTQFINRDKGLRIRSLTVPTKKMSKSSDDEKSKILLIDKPEVAVKKIMSATTDSVGVVNFDWENQPGITNMLQILAILTKRSQSDVNKEWVGCTKYGDFKKAVAESVKDFLINFQTKYNSISDEQILAKLEQSERDLTPIAGATLLRAQQAVGLRPKVVKW